MTEFRRNVETGLIELWEDGEKIDEIVTIGNEIDESFKPREKRKPPQIPSLSHLFKGKDGN